MSSAGVRSRCGRLWSVVAATAVMAAVASGASAGHAAAARCPGGDWQYSAFIPAVDAAPQDIAGFPFSSTVRVGARCTSAFSQRFRARLVICARIGAQADRCRPLRLAGDSFRYVNVRTPDRSGVRFTITWRVRPGARPIFRLSYPVYGDGGA